MVQIRRVDLSGSGPTLLSEAQQDNPDGCLDGWSSRVTPVCSLKL